MIPRLRGSALLFALVSFAACAPNEAESDDLDVTDDALTQTVSPRADGRFDVTCKSSGGISWSSVMTEAERAAGRLCSGVPYEMDPSWAPPRDGYRFVYDRPDIQIARFRVSRDANYRIAIPTHREWLGPLDHPEAGKPAKIAIFVDGQCAGAADAASLSIGQPDTAAVRVHLAPGDHQVGIVQTNDYWDRFHGFDRNVWAAPVKLARTTGKPTEAAADACAIHGEYPAVVATDRTQSVLANNDTPLARDFTQALMTWTQARTYDHFTRQFYLYKMFVYGFNLGPATHAAFANETNHFNLVPQTDLSRQSLDGIAAWWQPKLDELRARVVSDYAAALTTTAERDSKISVLDGLQKILNEAIKPMRATFDKYPEVANVKLDLR